MCRRKSKCTEACMAGACPTCRCKTASRSTTWPTPSGRGASWSPCTRQRYGWACHTPNSRACDDLFESQHTLCPSPPDKEAQKGGVKRDGNADQAMLGDAAVQHSRLVGVVAEMLAQH